DVDVSALVRGEAPIAGRSLYALAGVYGSVLIRAQRSLDGAITPMRDAVRPFDAGWLAGAGFDLATLGDATLSLEVRYQRGFFDRLSAPDGAATLQSLTWALGITYGAPSTRPGASETDPTTLHSANDQGEGKSAQRSGRTVSVRMARVGDRWLQDLRFARIERAHRDDVYGYQVTYHISGHGELFWARDDIDFDDSKPGRYRGKAIPLEKGRLLYPTRITSESLPDVHHWILVIEDDARRQADGATAAMEGFKVVAELGTGRYALRRTGPRTTPRTGTRTSPAATSQAATEGIQANRLAGQVGERFLARTYGGASQVTRRTSLGRRVIDNLANGIARESKVGRTALTKRTRLQIAKDVELMASPRSGVTGVEWHFFPGRSGNGPTAPLRRALERAGINIVIH
ncbi:hypothetical protein, partial [Haliangium sp.]|uniref:hypothetical protein n=1 Tax=Haliangium sp. TaxID=2663208 RepID=UPI003D13C0A8